MNLSDVCRLLASQPDAAAPYALSVAREMGRALHRDAVPPTVSRMVYRPHTGSGTISIHRTQSEFCRGGRSLNGVVERARVRDVRKLHLALVIDTSASMTASQGLPLAMAKIVSLTLVEAYSDPAVDVDLIACGADAKVLKGENDVLELQTGGPSQLDRGLHELRRMKWENRGGLKHLAVITRGPPAAEKENMMDDLEVQAHALNGILRLIDHGVKVMYVALAPDDKARGAHSGVTFAEKMIQVGASSVVIKAPAEIPRALTQAITGLSERSAIKELFW